MTQRPATIRRGRFMLPGQPTDRTVYLIVEDLATRSECLEIRMTPEDFGKLLSGGIAMRTPCTILWRGEAIALEVRQEEEQRLRDDIDSLI